jgi:hypothetical protein
VWDERLTGTDVNIWAQRIGPSGNLLWPARGKPICRSPDFQLSPVLVGDDAGGAYIAWEDWRESPLVQIYAQRIDASGNPRWQVNGILVSSDSVRGEHPVMVSDGAGGAFVAWHHGDIYAQRLVGTGPRWQQSGIVVCGAPGLQYWPAIDRTSDGGIVLAWADRRPGLEDIDAYAQKVDSTGAILWQPDGVPISTLENHQEPTAVVSDGAGGAIVAWPDSRLNDPGQYVQHVDASGTPRWTPNGTWLGGGPDGGPRVVPGAGGFIVVWADNRNGIYDEFYTPQNLDLFAARVTMAGIVDVPRRLPPPFRLLPARPNPTHAETIIPFELTTAQPIRLEIFSPLGQVVRSLARFEEFGAGRHELLWNGRNDAGRPVPPGVYLVRLSAAGQSAVGRITLLR